LLIVVVLGILMARILPERRLGTLLGHDPPEE